MSFQKTALGRLLCAAVALAAPLPALAEIPAGYPADYADIVAKAEAEGAVVIYANTEHAAVEPILADFQKAFPKIRADYIEIKAADLFSRVSSEAAAGALKADVVWSSAMDLQYQMVEDGIAAPYASTETAALPDWAHGDSIYATTYEPVVMVYNSKVIAPEEMPKSHAALAEWLVANKDAMQGKVATYDPERSGLGFFALSRDAAQGDGIWDVARALGAVDAKFYTSTGTMLRPDRKMRAQNGVHCHTSMMATAANEPAGLPSQSSGPTPNQPTTWLATPNSRLNTRRPRRPTTA